MRLSQSSLFNVLRRASHKSTTPKHYFHPLAEICARYMNVGDIEKVRQAFFFAEQAHKTQFRSSGEPYITHPVAVTEICASWHLDANALMAALLHDVMEDQGISKTEIESRFNSDVANLVDGLTKLDKIQFATKSEQQAESFRKMLLAMSQDIRVILIKLADRLHNMRTLGHCEPSKRRRIARETLEIYAPIANRLGLNAVVRELQDLCLAATYPLRYRTLQKALQRVQTHNRSALDQIIEYIRHTLPKEGIQPIEVTGRERSLFHIYQKMYEEKKSLSDVLDIYSVRILVERLPECYLTLGIVHQLYRPVPGKFKDYIAIPKINGYQSLHSTLIGPLSTPLEVQIRTQDMEHIAEKGVAAHWLYKNKQVSLAELQKQTDRWMQSLLDIQSQTGDSHEFLELIKVDLFPEDIFVLTPRGKIISLPRGATAVDFAYAIHTSIGHHAIAARINGELVPIDTVLSSGNVVEVITQDDAKPDIHWLNSVRTGRARSQIRHYLKTSQYEEAVRFGRSLLEQSLQNLHLPYPEDNHPTWEKLIKGDKAQSITEILAEIGLGHRLPALVARRFAHDDSHLIEASETELHHAEELMQPSIRIHGNEGQTVELAHCCCPIPGDKIIAAIRPGSGLIVHTDDCSLAKHQKTQSSQRWLDLEWSDTPAKHLPVKLLISIVNVKGVIGRIAVQVANANANITQINMQDQRTEIADIELTLEVDNRQHLAKVIRSIRSIAQVGKISRLKQRFHH